METDSDNLTDERPIDTRPMGELADVGQNIVASKAGMFSHLSQEELLVIGLCRSCGNSGMQRGQRNGVWGVLADSSGKILRCHCRYGDK